MRLEELQAVMEGKYYILRQKLSNGSDYILLVHVDNVHFDKTGSCTNETILAECLVAECQTINVEIKQNDGKTFYVDASYAQHNDFRIYGLNNYFIENDYKETTEEVWMKFLEKTEKVLEFSKEFLNY